MLGQLAPAGSRVRLKKSPPVDWKKFYPGYFARLYDSGTAALAVAIEFAAEYTARARDKNFKPEVILPAYGCPDLVSAAVFAGVTPVLVDLAPDSPNYSLSLLRQTISEKTVAVVAVNFLGIPEQLQHIRAMTQEFDCLLIEDNAQCFPDPDGMLFGDLVITSFGRGKPVSLLGGGLLLVRDALDITVEQLDIHQVSNFATCCKWILYNTLITPVMYRMVTNIPGLALGATEYKHLDGIKGVSSSVYTRLGSNIDKYLAKSTAKDHQFAEDFRHLKQYIIDLSSEHDVETMPARRLLRVPILVRRESDRDPLLDCLQRERLGATSFYGGALQDIQGVSDKVETRHPCTEANNFARRLVTLPNHDLVNHSHVVKILAVLDQYFG